MVTQGRLESESSDPSLGSFPCPSLIPATFHKVGASCTQPALVQGSDTVLFRYQAQVEMNVIGLLGCCGNLLI